MPYNKTQINPFVFDVAIVGNGPRGAAVNIHAVAMTLIESNDFKKLHSIGRPFRVKFHSFEKKAWEERAVGAAYSPTCHGVVNTQIAVPRQADTPSLDSLNERHLDIVKRAIDLRVQVQQHVESNMDTVLNEYKRVNVAAATTLMHATQKDGTVDTSLPYTTRGTQGVVMQKQFDSVIADGAKEVPFVEYKFTYNTEVVACDAVSNRFRPSLTVKDLTTLAETTYTFHHVILAEGIIKHEPLTPELNERTYLGPPNLDSIKNFFDRAGLLLANETLNPDARILVLGMGLSAIDKATIAAQTTGIAKVSQTRHDLLDWDFGKLDKYAGTFTHISRSTGPYVAPQHTQDAEWPGPTELPITRSMMRSAFIDRNAAALPTAIPILYAAAARALCTTPDKIPLHMQDIEQFQKETCLENDHYYLHEPFVQKKQTWAGYLRAGLVSITHGEDSNSPDAKEYDSFQCLFAGRSGWMAFRSMATIHSMAENGERFADPKFYRAWTKVVYPYAGSSPVCVAHFFASMFKYGVSSHIQSSFQDLQICKESGKIICKGKTFDCILGSPVIPVNGNNEPEYLPRGIKVTHTKKPVFGKGRLYQTPGGELCAVTDLGMIGHGVADKTSGGERTIRETDWLDTHSYASVLQMAPIIVKYIFCKAALTANGVQDAATDIDQRYRNKWVSEEQYQDAIRPLHTLHFASTAFDKAQTPSSREAFANYHNTGPKSCGAAFFNRLHNVPDFEPKTREQFYADCIDFTPDEINNIWKEDRNYEIRFRRLTHVKLLNVVTPDPSN
ncbi:unnamed protein product [Fusarium fujikuroi]|nr:unnamed protein product [Fusarium fujikuroi]